MSRLVDQVGTRRDDRRRTRLVDGRGEKPSDIGWEGWEGRCLVTESFLSAVCVEIVHVLREGGGRWRQVYVVFLALLL